MLRTIQPRVCLTIGTGLHDELTPFSLRRLKVAKDIVSRTKHTGITESTEIMPALTFTTASDLLRISTDSKVSHCHLLDSQHAC